MASVTLDTFTSEIFLEASAAPMPVVLGAVRNACIQFCKDSLVWREAQDPTPYAKGVPEYTLDAPPGAQVVGVIGITVDGKRALRADTIERISVTMPGFRSTEGDITSYVQPAVDTVRFIPVPQEDGAFYPVVAYAPNRSATAVPAFLYNLYFEAIKYGALWKLKAQVGQPWADPAGAADNMGKFLMACNDAMLEANRGNSRALLHVEPRSFV